VAGMAGLRFRPVGETHALATLAACAGFVSVNSVLEVDLTGQANAEALGGRQISGQSGLVDFLRGARASDGGRAILALPATAAGGRKSRIVPRLAAGTPVTVARGDVDLVVTEYGVADLREAGLAERARRLTAIAAPAFRDGLERELA
jgi:acyl-CoA hydrolase